MANTYKILGQKAPTNTNVDLYAPAASGTSAVLSTITVANTSTSDQKFSIYAQQTVPLGSIWQQVSSSYFISGSNKSFVFEQGGSVWAFGNYSYETNFIHKSNDGGVTWTQQTRPGNIQNIYQGVYSVKYSNGKFVILWQSGQFSTSVDGLVWTDPTSVSFPTGGLSMVVPTPTKTIAISNNKEVMESTDGTTWTEVTSNLSTLFTDQLYGFDSIYYKNTTVVVGNDVYVLFMAGSDNNMDGETQRTVYKTSDNGATWVDTGMDSVFTGQVPMPADIFYLNGKIIVVVESSYDMMTMQSIPGKIAESSDLGQTWVLRSTPRTSNVIDIIYKNSTYYVLSHDGMYAYIDTSADLQTFSSYAPYINVMSSQASIAILNSNRVLVWGGSSSAISSTIAPADQARAIFHQVALPASSTVTLSLGISLGYGDRISVGESSSGNSNGITYTAFGSEITA